MERFHDASARPETTLVFEDAWNGVCAGLAAGMHVVWVPDLNEAPGLPSESPGITAEMKSRVHRLSSLEDFDPTLFGLPPYPYNNPGNYGQLMHLIKAEFEPRVVLIFYEASDHPVRL